jgi:hypothetical protein
MQLNSQQEASYSGAKQNLELVEWEVYSYLLIMCQELLGSGTPPGAVDHIPPSCSQESGYFSPETRFIRRRRHFILGEFNARCAVAMGW